MTAAAHRQDTTLQPRHSSSATVTGSQLKSSALSVSFAGAATMLTLQLEPPLNFMTKLAMPFPPGTSTSSPSTMYTLPLSSPFCDNTTHHRSTPAADRLPTCSLSAWSLSEKIGMLKGRGVVTDVSGRQAGGVVLVDAAGVRAPTRRCYYSVP